VAGAGRAHWRTAPARSGGPLSDAVVAALAARTEGWAAGLQLAALSLRGQPDAEGFVSAFTGSHRFILDFLAEEVLEQQSDQVRTFLLETSVLDRLSGELCDAVTGRAGSQALLEQVERAGLFLVPLDEVRGWWRYHHLFADLLQARLQQEQADRVVHLHRSAATWCQEHGLPDDAQRAGPAAAAVPLGYLARLRSAFGAEPAAPHPAAVAGLIDPLTSRELEVLQMLAAGKSNQAIADELVVTLDTVKKHVSHLLGKLGAANRTETVSRARELSLIS
jgi:ATP/maltotriose-dependent transcriptional regulator MalT